MSMLMEIIQTKKMTDNGREMVINEAVFKRQEVVGCRTHEEDLTLIGRGSLPQL